IVPDRVVSRAVLDRRTVQYRPGDAESAADFPNTHAVVRSRGIAHGIVSVPLLSQGEAIGTITAVRASAQRFSTNEIAQLETFADQAVIAIENARLFRELQERNRELEERTRELGEALARQTAMAEVLRVMSQSPTDAQPVFDAVVERAVRLCAADFV